MEMDLINKPLGSEGNIELELKEGKLNLIASHNSKGAGVSLNVSLDSDYFIDKLAAVIPGQIDDAIFAILKAALKK